MTFKRAVKLSVLVAIATGSAAASAVSIPFSETFDGYVSNPGDDTDLNWSGGIIWEVTNGTIDLVDGNVDGNTYGVSCYGGSGGCVDLDGSDLSQPNGRLQLRSAEEVQLTAGETYTLSAQIAGNERSGDHDPDQVQFGFLFGGNYVDQGTETENTAVSGPGATSGTGGFLITGELDYTEGWNLYTLVFTPTVTGGYLLAFQNLLPPNASDFAGARLDNISLVPIPAAAWLLLSGLGAVGAMARRRRALVPAAA